MGNGGSVRQRVARDYFRTTSAAGVAVTETATQASMAGLRRRLKPWLELAGLRVVDLGAGTGELCRVLEDAGAAEVTGVNLSSEEIEFARSLCTAQFVHADIGTYLDALPEMSVDRIFALNILEHLDKEQLVGVLHGTWRALRPGGSLVAMVPNATSPFGGMTRYWDITHENAFTPSSVTQLARLVGFDDRIEFRECGPVAHGIVSAIRYALWQLIRVGIKGRLLVETASTKGGIYTADMLFCLRKEK